jgi:S1-C subfamily serine protease
MRLRLLAVPALLLTSVAADGQTARVYAAPSAGALRINDDQPRAVIGISTAGSTSPRDTLGLLVTSVAPNSPAEKAGIQEGDRIASVNGVNLKASPDDAGEYEVSNAMTRRLTRELSKVRPGDDVDLRVYADGRTRTIHLRTADSESIYSKRRLSRDEVNERPTIGLGLGATSSRRDTLGIFVMFVDDSGPAARAGIEEGNRIAAIDEIDLRVSRDDAGDPTTANSKIRRLQREVARLHPGDNVDLRVYANGEFRNVRLRVARGSDLRRRGAVIIGGDGFGMSHGLPLDFDGALVGEQVRTAIEQAMEASGRALEGVGRGLNRARIRMQDDEEPSRRRVAPKEPREPREPTEPMQPMEPMEPIRIEPLEPSRFRRLAPMRVPFTSAVHDDSSVNAPMVEAAIDRGRTSNAAALDVAGLRLVSVGSELASYLGRGSERGLLVVDVPRWAQGSVRAGDVVLSVDGTRVRSGDGGDEVTISLPRFREAQLDILRDGMHHSVTLPARR